MTRAAIRVGVLSYLLGAACAESSSATDAGIGASVRVLEAPRRERSPANSASATIAAATLGSLALESRSLGWDSGTKLEISAAFAHLRDEWPTPRGGLPRLVIDRIELYGPGATGMSCTAAGVASAGSFPSAIVLQGKRKVDLEWEKDFALGDDFELCLINAAAPGHAQPTLVCPGFDLGRPNVILSLSRDRAKGFVNAKGPFGSVNGSFNAEVCPLPPLE